MKRSFLILLMSLLILLPACRSSPPAIVDSYEGEITVSGGALDCAAHLSITPDSVALVMTSPPSVAGIGYTFSKNDLSTDYGDLRCITDAESLPATAPASLLYAVFSRLSEAQYEGSDSSGDRYRLSVDIGDASVICRGGVPVSLTAAGCPYTVTFSR